MKFPAIATLVLLSSLVFGQTTSWAPAIHAEGVFASASGFDNGTNIFLETGRGTNPSTGEQTTFLFFNIFSFTTDGFTSTFGNGFIPNDSLVGADPAHITLNVDTGQVDSFETSTCTFSFTTFLQTCSSGPTGLISVDWKQNGAFSIHSVSTSQETFSQVSFQSHGDSDQSSATANGTVLASAVSNGSGLAGTNHNTTISLIRNQ